MEEVGRSGMEGASGGVRMQWSVRRGSQLGWGVVLLLSFLFVLPAALGRAGHQSDTAESDILHVGPDIYNDGPLKVDLFFVYSASLRGSNSHRFWRGKDPKHGYSAEVKIADEPPRPLLIAVPEESGEYPVIVLQHGFTLKNHFYAQLMYQVASHGFVVVAPQMYKTYSGTDATEEICHAGEVIDWLPKGLSTALAQRVSSVKPNLSKLALVGHSRGGKVAFGLATGVYRPSLNISAIAGLDPVDGMGVEQQTVPPILQFSEHSLKLGMPTLIVGAGLGNQRKNWLFPACAPDGVSHNAFFYESDRPAFHFVAPDYGHMDYMDDDTNGIQGVLTYYMCKNGPSRAPMRKFSAGILVAFFQACLQGDSSQLSDAVANPSLAPVPLQKPETYGVSSDFLAARGKGCVA